jgi:hypothetical protein
MTAFTIKIEKIDTDSMISRVVCSDRKGFPGTADFFRSKEGQKIVHGQGLFTPCAVENSLLEALSQAAENAVFGRAVLLSPACSSFEDSQNKKFRGELLPGTSGGLANTMNCGASKREHNMRPSDKGELALRKRMRQRDI